MKWTPIKAMQAVLTGAALLLNACTTTQAEAKKAAVAGSEEAKAVLWVGNSFFGSSSIAL